MSYTIPLYKRNNKTHDEKAIVSKEDYDNVSKYRWCLNGGKYAVATINDENVLMHHFIMGKPKDNMVIDHINHVRLDNRRENLRIVTQSQNAQNAVVDPNKKTSKYIGVCYYKTSQKWAAKCNKQHLGYFENEQDAAKVYDKYAYIVFGEGALTNKLVDYNDVIGLTVDDILPKKKEGNELPPHISYHKNNKTYDISISYKKKKFRSYHKRLEDAEAQLAIYKKEIEKLKEADDNNHNNQEILVNDEGQAIIPIKNKDGEVVLNAIVDHDKWHELMKYNWRTCSSEYIFANMGDKVVRMHKFLLNNDDKDLVIDHINNVRYDNRLSNLRIVTHSNNSHNVTKKEGTSSKYMGVRKKGNRYEASIRCKAVSKKPIYLGLYKTEKEAAQAYNIKAVELYGENANKNVILEN